MKNRILTVALVATTMIALGSSAFGQENRKAKKARKEMAEAKEDLKLAKTDSTEDYNKFKKEAELDILENDRKIIELKTKKESDNSDENEKYKKKVAMLEEKNELLKTKLKYADNTKNSGWAAFKKEFKRDLKELGEAFKDLGVKNEK